MTTKISAVGVTQTFLTRSGPLQALDNLHLHVEEGEFLCIVGPSGCGKSTLLRILGGLLMPTAGNVELVAGKTGLPLQRMVFQEYALFPWKTVVDNVAFGLQMIGVSRSRRREIALDWLHRVGLSNFADSYPHQLSGGMKQRASIARAFANDPEILLMDEPLGALDAQTRAVLQQELVRLCETTRKTVVYVTHSIEEAVWLGDRIVLMTARPGANKSEYVVPFDRPREFALTSTPEFGRLSFAIWQDLKSEVMQAMERRP